MGPRRAVAPSQEGPQAAHGVDRLEARPHLTGDERLPRSRRLVRGIDLRRVLGTGRRSRRDHLDIFWASGETGHPRLGLVVPRHGQTAVARNRLRRRLREIWRREMPSHLPPLDVVIRTRKEAFGASFTTLQGELLAWVEKVAR